MCENTISVGYNVSWDTFRLITSEILWLINEYKWIYNMLTWKLLCSLYWKFKIIFLIFYTEYLINIYYTWFSFIIKEIINSILLAVHDISHIRNYYRIRKMRLTSSFLLYISKSIDILEKKRVKIFFFLSIIYLIL